MRYLLLSVLVACMIGVMVPSDSAVFKVGYKVEKIDFKTKSVIFSKGVRD